MTSAGRSCGVYRIGVEKPWLRAAMSSSVALRCRDLGPARTRLRPGRTARARVRPPRPARSPCRRACGRVRGGVPSATLRWSRRRAGRSCRRRRRRSLRRWSAWARWGSSVRGARPRVRVGMHASREPFRSPGRGRSSPVGHLRRRSGRRARRRVPARRTPGGSRCARRGWSRGPGRPGGPLPARRLPRWALESAPIRGLPTTALAPRRRARPRRR